MNRGIRIGALAGLLAGIVFGLAMGFLPVRAPDGGRISMLLFTAQALHAQSPAIGWVTYLAYGVVIGGLFGWLLRGRALDEGPALVLGGAYGLGWWVLAGLVLMPALLGRVPFSSSALDVVRPIALVLLAGHLLYGLLLGMMFGLTSNRIAGRPA
jgi:hypothetical protein